MATLYTTSEARKERDENSSGLMKKAFFVLFDSYTFVSPLQKVLELVMIDQRPNVTLSSFPKK